MKLIDILLRRSPRNAAVPNVQPGPSGVSPGPNMRSLGRLVDQDIEIHSSAGLLNELRRVEGHYEGSHGELIRCVDDRQGMILGCNHPVTRSQAGPNQNRSRDIAGLCVFCVREFQELVKKGQMDPLEAERRSLVCTECARMTTSGHLSCPRHCQAIVAPDGTTQYLDAESARNLARQATVTKAFNAVLWLFGRPQEQQKDKAT